MIVGIHMTKRHTDTNTINGAANNDKCKMTNGLHNHHSILIDLSLGVKISFVPTVRKRHLKYYISPILIGCCQIWIRFAKYKLSSFESNYVMKQQICNRLQKNQKRYMVAAVVFARTEVVSLVALTMNELTPVTLKLRSLPQKKGL